LLCANNAPAPTLYSPPERRLYEAATLLSREYVPKYPRPVRAKIGGGVGRTPPKKLPKKGAAIFLSGSSAAPFQGKKPGRVPRKNMEPIMVK